ncbi:MAG: hypothetical protein AAB631_02395 [Patescibacteria group bacterium]
MFWICYLPIVVVVVLYIIISNNNRDWGVDSVWSALVAGFWTLIIGAIIMLVIGIVVKTNYSDDDYIKTTEVQHLYAFNDRFSTNGSFFLGSGNIGPTAYYYYYEALPNGGKRLRKVNAEESGVEIYEENRSDGVVNIRHFDCETELRFFYLRFGGHQTPAQKFFVPKGTILNGFSADLQ